MRVLITGAGGFLGGALAHRLAGLGEIDVIASARRPSPGLPNSRPMDLLDQAAVRRVVCEAAPDVVVHAAGRTYAPPERLRVDNIEATANLVGALQAAAPGAKLLLLGSAAQYGVSQTCAPWRETDPCVPAGAYGAAKLGAEQCARASGLDVTALRLFNVVAPEPRGEQVFDTFLRRAAVALAGPPPRRVRMGPLSAVRDFVAADDVLTVIQRVIQRGVWGETINVCTGLGRPVRDLLDAVAAPCGLAIEEDAGPAGLPWSVGDPARCEALLGFRPSSDLTAIMRGAAAWLAAKGAADARSRA